MAYLIDPAFRAGVIAFILLLLPGGAFAQDFFTDADQFFRTLVRNDRVDYRSISEQPADLNLLIDRIALTEVDDGWADSEIKAFLINAYNLLVIKGVVDNYPLKSPLDVKGFFDDKQHTVAGKRVSLNQLEKDWLLSEFEDPRLHFALVCGAVSCPPLIPEAYTPATLDEHLTRQTARAINDPEFTRIDSDQRVVRLSEIFNWYEDDFTGSGQTVVDFINKYRTTPIPDEFTIEYYNYDWSLNALGANLPDRVEKDNLQSYTPSTLLQEREIEFKLFNNLYSQNSYFDDDGDEIDEGKRSSYLSSIFSLLYGLHQEINIGVDLYLKSVRIDESNSSPFAALGFGGGIATRTDIALVAAKVKTPLFRYFSSNPVLRDITLQGTFVLPVGSDLEGTNDPGEPFLEYDDAQVWLQLLYDAELSESFLVYTELGGFFRFDQTGTVFNTPVKVFLNYYLSSSSTFYIPFEVNPTWGGADAASTWKDYYVQTGLGAKYLLLPNFEIEALYTVFPLGRIKGASATYNLGFRILR